MPVKGLLSVTALCVDYWLCWQAGVQWVICDVLDIVLPPQSLKDTLYAWESELEATADLFAIRTCLL